MLTTILIANRGEIACRIIRTAKRLGIHTIAVYSTADANSLHVNLADEAFCIGAPPAIESYLNINAILDIAKAQAVDGIHPGYGFLSENVDFARACEKARIIFIGPSIFAMQAMASKQLAKQHLEKTNVPLAPGYHGQDQSDSTLLKEAKKIGFPVLLKAASGGGGKGMRSVYQEADFNEALASARREAKASFGDDAMIIEKLIDHPRHVEMQIMADNHGNIVHLFERDCSIQRRHQKIIEEAPASHLSDKLREHLAKAAIEVASAIQYRGAGTVEFLVAADQSFYFMEMNTRLQVEHPVTEMITNLDLVEWQLRIAANEKLPASQRDIIASGHAIECRIYAEDPAHGFLPSIGNIHFLKEPAGEFIRIETGVTAGSVISPYYDPMIAKLIAFGETRELARTRLLNALDHYHIGGVKTNLSFLKAILSHPHFIQNNLSTHFLTENELKMPSQDNTRAICLAAGIDYLQAVNRLTDPLYKETFAWQLYLKSHWLASYLIEGTRFDVVVAPLSLDEVELTLSSLNDKRVHLQLSASSDVLQVRDDQGIYHVFFERIDDAVNIYFNEGCVEVRRFNWQNKEPELSDHNLTAPMPGTVVAILKKTGESIQTGEALMVLEAMKMEHTIRSPHDGTIRSIFYEIGAQVQEGATLADLEKI